MGINTDFAMLTFAIGSSLGALGERLYFNVSKIKSLYGYFTWFKAFIFTVLME